jgi:hypothetical protein
MGFQGFKEWLGVLVVNDLISYRSFILQGSSRKKKRFKYFLWSFSVSMSRMRRRINPFKQQFASSQEGFLFDHRIYHYIHYVIIS